MRTIIIILLAIGIGCIILLAIDIGCPVFEVEASSRKDNSYYKSQIEKKIKQCENKGRFIYSDSINLQCYGKYSLTKASFLKKNKEQLVQTMIYENTPKKEYTIGYFLDSYFRKHVDFATNIAKSSGSEGLLSNNTKP